MSFLVLFKLVGSLALLMYGMKIMSEGLQKFAGGQLRHVLGAMTTNRFTGLLTGVLITAAIQSSTATTVMTVSFVNAGLLSLAQAISVIMGANVGTTLTAWIMSAGLGFNISDFVYPFFFIAIFLFYSSKRKAVGEFIFGLGFLLLGLGTLKANAVEMDLGHNAAVLDFFESTGQWGFLSTLLFLVLGGLLTLAVQSSAAIVAITMILCSQGALGIEQGIALVMGENIGTTITSNIVAMTANSQARRAALAHLFFNMFGVVWVLILFHPFVSFVCSLAGYDMDMAKDAPEALRTANNMRLNFVIPAFHSLFNVCNVLILIWFVNPIEKFVSKMIAQKDDEDTMRLHYITGGLLSTAELSVLEAAKEIINYGQRTQKMFHLVRELLETKNDVAFVKLFSRIEKYENISDSMEVEIANYLNKVSDERLSPETKMKIRAMLREISEIESIGDSCFNLARSINRYYKSKLVFTDGQKNHVHQMFELTDQALEQMNDLLSGRMAMSLVNQSFNTENEINNFRTQLKKQNIIDVDNREYDYRTGTTYMDIINECEKLGDYVINVIEARTEHKATNP
ncbi:MAG: Na/Pi cotransporter family protein [Paludibacteraceae bacterium]|nr:Na/Pi cotransporter family protein [Paludibacteraceae bacterium]MBR6285635.1 Na/Pi cotransporter family protein [Bacteroidaceae bacterium]